MTCADNRSTVALPSTTNVTPQQRPIRASDVDVGNEKLIVKSKISTRVVDITRKSWSVLSFKKSEVTVRVTQSQRLRFIYVTHGAL